VNTPESSFHEILERFTADAESAFSETNARIRTETRTEARAEARNELAGQLNQAVRRICQAATRDELGDTLADTASAFAAGAAWFRVDDGAARSEKLDLTVPLSDSAALKHAVDTREPVIALATPGEVSPLVAERFAHSANSRAHVYPVLSAAGAAALLYTWADAPGGAQNDALELLTQCASAAWQALEPPPPPPPPPEPLPQLVTIVAPPAPPPKPVDPWDALSAQDQQAHLRAQRFARVQVAEIRLRKAAAVQSGRLRRNLYAALRDSIDTARAEYRKEFFAHCPSMVDYLHLELTRTLANDDPDLLGNEYPGPMV
jgi:hypothetical protein